jgi:hypothetical protein
MIKSKYDTLWFGFLTYMLCWCLFFFLIGFSQYFLNYKILGIGMRLDINALPLCFIGLTGTFFFCLFLWREANIISIDPLGKIISFKNIFTRRTESFSFSELSGYIDTIQRTRRSNFKVLYIVQNKKYIKKISSAMYKNFDELLNSLNSLNSLGFRKLGLKERFQILFNKTMLD